MENDKAKFYPNAEYNRKRRTKYFVLFAVLVAFTLLFDGFIIAGLRTETAGVLYTTPLLVLLNGFVIVFIALIPKTLREHPTDRRPVMEIDAKEILLMGKKYERGAVVSVSATVYLGKVGNLVEDRQFLEKVAAERPPENMIGSFEIALKGPENKNKTAYVVCENVVEALLIFVKEGKVSYKLGYSLGKEYRPSTYNLKETLAPQESAPAGAKSKTKQLL